MKSDKEIWQEKFKNGDTIKDFKTLKGPPLNVPQSKEDKEEGLKRIKFWKGPSTAKNTLEKRVEELEKELTKIKKYLNYSSRQSKRNTSEPNQPQQQPQVQPNKESFNETQNK